MAVGKHETALIRHYNDRTVFGLILIQLDSALDGVT
jgi:hypothetical protein